MAQTISTGSGKLSYNGTLRCSIYDDTSSRAIYLLTSSAEGTFTSAYPVALTYTTAAALTVTQATVGNDVRGARFLFTVATPAMSDGYGIFEIDATISGSGTGDFASTSTWTNIGGGGTAASGANCLIHSDGIWSGGTISGAHMAMHRYQAVLNASNYNDLSIFQLNFNQTVTSVFDVNDQNKALGFSAGSPSASAIGTIPFCASAGGGIRYIYLYENPA